MNHVNQELQRFTRRDLTSISFSRVGDKYPHARRDREAVEVCRAGPAVSSGYLSARVTLGRSLIELGPIDDGRRDPDSVLKSAPENLAALQWPAAIHVTRADRHS